MVVCVITSQRSTQIAALLILLQCSLTHSHRTDEPVGIYSVNRAEWVITDLACGAYRWPSVALYDTLGNVKNSRTHTITCIRTNVHMHTGHSRTRIHKHNAHPHVLTLAHRPKRHRVRDQTRRTQTRRLRGKTTRDRTRGRSQLSPAAQLGVHGHTYRRTERASQKARSQFAHVQRG